MGQEGVAGGAANIQKERAVVAKDAPDFRCPAFTPLKKAVPRRVVIVRSVFNPQVIGRRGDDQVDAFALEISHATEAITVMELE